MFQLKTSFKKRFEKRFLLGAAIQLRDTRVTGCFGQKVAKFSKKLPNFRKSCPIFAKEKLPKLFEKMPQSGPSDFYHIKFNFYYKFWHFIAKNQNLLPNKTYFTVSCCSSINSKLFGISPLKKLLPKLCRFQGLIQPNLAFYGQTLILK